LIDSFQNYLGLRMASGGVVMKTDADTSFKITIDGAGNWTVAQGHIINDNQEVVENVIDGLSPASGLEPGDLTGDNPLVHGSGITQYIVVQTKDKTQEVDFGSITVLAASNAVVGTDTQFTKWFEAGSKMNVANSGLGNNDDYIVQSVIDDTHLTTVNNFTADEPGLKFSVLGTFFEGYPPGGNKNLHIYNSFTFRTTIAAPVLADGEYTLAKCTYSGGLWSAEDQRSGNLFTLPGIRTAEIIDAMITLAKMANDSVDENKIVSTTFGAGLEGGSGVKPTISNLGVTTAMLDNLAVTLGKMASDSVDENKITNTTFDEITIGGGGGVKPGVIEQPKFHVWRNTLQSIPDSSYTTVVFGNVSYDSENKWDPINYCYTIPINGKYNINAIVTLDDSVLTTSQVFEMRLVKNGSRILRRRTFGNGSSIRPSVVISGDFSFSVDDVLRIEVYQNTGGARNLSNLEYEHLFSGHLIL